MPSREGIAEPGLREQERRPEPEPADGQDRAGQVPRPEERLVPAGRRGDRLAADAIAEEQPCRSPRRAGTSRRRSRHWSSRATA